MRSNLCSALLDFVARSNPVASNSISESECAEIARTLEILRPSPAPDLARGRLRVLAEVASLEYSKGQTPNTIRGTRQRLEIAFAGIVLALMAGAFAVTLPGWYSTLGGNPISNLFSTPTLAVAPAHLTGASVTSVNPVTPTMNLSPLRTAIALTEVPGKLGGPSPAAAATPGSLLTLTRSAQMPPAH